MCVLESEFFAEIPALGIKDQLAASFLVLRPQVQVAALGRPSFQLEDPMRGGFGFVISQDHPRCSQRRDRPQALIILPS